MRINRNLDFAIARSEFILLPFSFRFSWSFYSRYLSRFVFFLAAVKSKVLIMGKPGNGILVTTSNITTSFAQKPITFINLLCQNVNHIQIRLLCR